MIGATVTSSDKPVPPGTVAVEIVPEPPKKAAQTSAIRSLIITASGYAAGLTVQAFLDPSAQIHDANDFLIYVKVHLVGFIVTNILVPFWRGTIAYKRASEAQKINAAGVTPGGGE